VRRRALAKSITGYHKNMVRKQCPVLELANQMPVRNMDLARPPCRTARKKGSGYENGGGAEEGRHSRKRKNNLVLRAMPVRGLGWHWLWGNWIFPVLWLVNVCQSCMPTKNRNP
jgi:hypothetical protein